MLQLNDGKTEKRQKSISLSSRVSLDPFWFDANFAGIPLDSMSFLFSGKRYIKVINEESS